MFIFFINDLFYSFWQNKKGDEFFDLTCTGLNLEASQVSLNYYAGINAIPEFFDFDQNKNLIIKEKVTTIENEIEVIEFITVATINAESYAVNGDKVQLC